jgi:hypothetical protein
MEWLGPVVVGVVPVARIKVATEEVVAATVEAGAGAALEPGCAVVAEATAEQATQLS